MYYDTPVMKLGNLVDVKGGKRLPNGSNLQLEENDHPYIRVRDMGQRFILNIGLEYVPDDVFPSIKKYIVGDNDIIISIVGTIGLVSIIDSKFEGASLSENCAKLTGLDKTDAQYVYYFLNSSLGKQEIRQATVGAVQAKLPLYSIEKIQLPWPERSTRERIVSVLSAIDDKIELNLGINQTLEAIAQAIFKSWFIDFEPIKVKKRVLESGGSIIDAEREAMCYISGIDHIMLTHMRKYKPIGYAELAKTVSLFPTNIENTSMGEKPEGWEFGNLSDLILFNPKRTLKKGEVASYLDMKNLPTSGHLALDVVQREMGSGTKFINGDTLLARITPCLENGKTAFVDFLEEDEVCWGSTEYIVMRPKEGYHPSLGYFIARNEFFRSVAKKSMTGTSGRQRANANVLAELQWLIYPQNLVERFSRFSEMYLKVAKNNGAESKTLIKIRDSILEKLFLGNMDICFDNLNIDEVSL